MTCSLSWLACTLVLIGAAAAEEPKRPTKFAVKDARIVPVSSAPLERGTVLIDDGLIVAVGARVEVPDDAWIIDGQGLTVFPGLIDALTAIGLPKPSRGQQRTAVAAPGTANRQPYSRGPADRPATTPWKIAADLIDPADERIKQWRNAGFTSAVVTPQEGIFPGQASLVNLVGERRNELAVEPRAALYVRLTQRNSGYRGYPGSLLGWAPYVRQVFLDASHYRDASALYRENAVGRKRPGYDPTLEPVQDLLGRHKPVLLPANESKEIARVVRLTHDIGAPTVIYGGQQSYELADALAASGIPILVNLDWPKKPKDPDPEAEETLRQLRFRDRAPSTPAALAKAGVLFAFYSGSISKPSEILDKVNRAIAAGLPKEAALEALTLGAARIFHFEDRLGSLEAGKIANLLITEGDLFAEKRKLRMVFIDGRKFDIPKAEPPPKEDSKPEGDRP